MSTSTQSIPKQLSNSTGYAMLLMDGLKLLIPQEEIKAMESTNDIEVSVAVGQDLVAGYIQFENRSWPVFSFSHKLSLLTSVALNRQFCILLQTGNSSFGVLSEQAQLLNPGEIYPQPLPEPMLMTGSPITALAIFEGEAICVSSAERLEELLPQIAASKSG